MRKVTPSLLILLLIAVPGLAQERERPSGYQLVLGPRVGANYFITSSEDFTDRVNDLGCFPESDYIPVMSLFGISLEQRILLGGTRSHFAFQEVLVVNGLEQSIALPSASFLVGYRDWRGPEFGVGPNVSPHKDGATIGVIVAAGYTFSKRGVFVPVDLSVILPNARRPPSVAVTTGFNFIVRETE